MSIPCKYRRRIWPEDNRGLLEIIIYGLWFCLRIGDPGPSSRYRALPCNAWTIRGSASPPISYVCFDLRQSLDRLSDQMFGRLLKRFPVGNAPTCDCLSWQTIKQTLYQGDVTLQGGEAVKVFQLML